MDASPDARPVFERAGRREWFGLLVLAVPTLLINFDLSVLYLAVPHLTAALEPSSTQQLWILDIYGFMVAGFLITMGRLGDRIGRRKLLLIGSAVFGIASAVAAYSTSAEMLLVARVVLGIAGASLAPCTLALIKTMFTNPKQRGVAVSIWMGCFMGGAVIGPIVGGILLTNFWWGSVFLLAVPVMVAVLIVAPILLPEAKDPAAERLDLFSVALSLAAVLPFVYGIKQLASAGWQPLSLVLAVAGVAFGAAFIVRQRKIANPLLDLSLFGDRTFRGSFVLSLLGGALSGGTMLLVNLYLQLVNGYSPLKAGLWLVPTAVVMLVTIGISQGLAQKIRPAYVMSGGMVISAIGYLVLTQLDSTGGLALVVVGWGLAIVGLGPAAALGYDMILSSAPPEKIGSASGTVETGGQVGAAMGIALLGSLGTFVYGSQIEVSSAVPGQAADVARDSLAGAVAVAERLPAAISGELVGSARAAFTSGLQWVAVLGAVVFLGMAAYAVRALAHVPPTAQTESVEADDVPTSAH
ncbi:MAG: MFS transporter [Actinophytocola sp.]|uniref:MFS transporter n=1 Tax=Actinophytocola sp. TaxID=1872138 RepID=UPI001326553E|nr:MFS transporter [Actinophytocola sp.]MPZ81298.1 MFS transporter [Actinophytocola sp.]